MMSDSVYVMATPDLLDGWVGPVEDSRTGEYLASVLYVQAADAIDIGEGGVVVPRDRIRLDLRIPQVMDRAARVLAARVGLECGATAPGWSWSGDWFLGIGRSGMEFGRSLRLGSENWTGAGGFYCIPGISSITDPAEAMRLALEATA